MRRFRIVGPGLFALCVLPGSLTVLPTAGIAPAEAHDGAAHDPPEAGARGAACRCAEARLESGWCARHGTGYVASVPIRSKLLYETLDAHGHTLDPGAFTCDACRTAMRTDGYCERDRIGFVKQQAYFSRLTWELARGTKRAPESIACRQCRRHSRSHGWCESCGVGMIGAVQAKDRESYDRAAAAVEILAAASTVAARCEACAMAMVTDSLCPQHRVSYRDGKPAPSRPAAP